MYIEKHTVCQRDNIEFNFFGMFGMYIVIYVSISNMKHHRTSGPDWRINLLSDKSYLVTGPTVPKSYCFGEYNKILCFNQPIKSHIGKMCLAASIFCLLSCLGYFAVIGLYT